MAPVLRTLLLTCLAAAIACGEVSPPADQPQPPRVDSRPDAQVPIEPCTLSPSRIELREGVRDRFVLTVEPEAEWLALDELPAGFELELDGRSLQARAPYGSGAEGERTIRILARCDGIDQSLELVLAPRAPRWVSTSTWTQDIDGPLGREYGSMWIDQQDPDRLLLFGGYHYRPRQFTPGFDLWERDLTTDRWRQLTPSNAPMQAHGVSTAPIAGERAALFFGGVEHAGDGDYNVYALMRFDYAPDQLTWSNAGSARLPVGEWKTAWIHDAPRNRYVSACGMNVRDGLHCDVKAYYPDGDRWERLTPAGDEAPTPRRDFFFVHDAASERLILFSGDQNQGQGWACDCAHDTWALELAEDPVRWVRLDDGSTQMIGRRNGAAVLDPIGRRWFVWGGTPDGRFTIPGLYALDLERGKERWELVIPEGSAPERSSGMGVYDAARNRLLFGFGNNPFEFADLWALEL